jgi:drug/metabolite transporter (DMT)-like permease
MNYRPDDRGMRLKPAVLAVAATVLLWGSAFAAIRTAVADLGPVPLSVARLVVASLALAVVAPFLGVRLPRRRDLLRIAVAGAAGMTVYQLLLNTGQVHVPAGTASLLVATAPVHAALLARLLLGERITWRAQVGIAVAFTGAVVLALGRGAGAAPLPAMLTVLGAAASQAAFFVVQKPLLDRYSPLAATCHATWAGTLLILPFGAGAPAALADAGPAALASLAWLGIGASALGFVMWSAALARLPVSGAVSTLNLVPLVAVASGWLLQGEAPTVLVLAGGALAVGGVILVRPRLTSSALETKGLSPSRLDRSGPETWGVTDAGSKARRVDGGRARARVHGDERVLRAG